LNISFEDATTLFIYLVPEGMKALAPLLASALERNVRIVTYGKKIVFIVIHYYYYHYHLVFSIPGLKPTKVETYKNITKIYLYQ